MAVSFPELEAKKQRRFKKQHVQRPHSEEESEVEQFCAANRVENVQNIVSI